jgi:hypothetical protein
VVDALTGNSWLTDIRDLLTVPVIMQYIHLHEWLKALQLNEEVVDSLVWRWSSNARYSSWSAYEALFVSQSVSLGAKEIWKVRAPNKCMLFFWQVMHEHVWTSEHLHNHGLDNHGPCALCSQEVESLNHLFVGCSYSREIWFKCLRHIGLRQLMPLADDSLLEWWLRSRKQTTKARIKAFDSFIFLVTWHLCLERNARVFRSSVASLSGLIQTSLINAICGVKLVW